MRVGFITQWFPPEPGTVVAARIAGGLAARGHTVDVVTGYPNYPTGRLHEGYRLRPHLREEWDGFCVHRCLLYPSHDRSSAGRALNYLSFAAGARWGLSKVTPPDVWLVYSSPATAAIPALLAGRSRSAPVCLIIQDLWPDSVTDSGFLGPGPAGLARHLLGRFCDWTYRRSATVGVISPSMDSVLRLRGVPPAKIFYTPNPAPEGIARTPTDGQLRRRLGLPDGRLFMYAGNLGELQGLEPLILAFRQVPEASLVLVGDGVERERLEDLTQRMSATNIRFLGARPAPQAQELVAASDVQVVSLKDTALLRATMPSKLQSILGAGKPVLAHAAGDVAALVDQQRCGWTATPGDLPALVERIHTACRLSPAELSRLGERGRAHAEATFAPEIATDRLETMLLAAQQAQRVAA